MHNNRGSIHLSNQEYDKCEEVLVKCISMVFKYCKPCNFRSAIKVGEFACFQIHAD
jgi:hypothetical protein